MKNIIKILLVLLAGVFIISSCMKEEEDMFNSPDNNTTTYLQFTDLNDVFAMTPADTLPFTFEFGIKLNGNTQASDLNVNFEVVSTTVNLDSQVVVSSYTVIIPANTYYGTVEMTIDPNKFVLSADTLKLNLKIVEGTLTLAPFGADATFGFIYNVCPFDILDFLGGFKCDEVDYEVYDVNFSLDAIVPNRIYNSNFWDWAAAGATVYYDFSGDENQVITIPNQPFEFGDGTIGSVEGIGTYDACTGKFETLTDVEYGGTIYPTIHYFFREGDGKSATIISQTKAEIMKN
ncbi:MAG: hypothetical protein HN704_07305 [Bacteroidetes bacterium]|jgi:hypothetical protein|nr:hypothetical protein [Bacteroidota bacterium]MBT6687643.1 hypothetical protein [Bacteroidota bacterium]MBT7144768.1 hypothetical protein [Bacteroidota bacterium]MBT7491395.1 hypothetical protein [Bacteroidota bacterium]